MTEEISQTMTLGTLLGFIAGFVMCCLAVTIMATNLLKTSDESYAEIVNGQEGSFVYSLTSNPDGTSLAEFHEIVNVYQKGIAQIKVDTSKVKNLTSTEESKLKAALTWVHTDELKQVNFDDNPNNDVTLAFKSNTYIKGYFPSYRIKCIITDSGKRDGRVIITITEVIKGKFS